MKTLTGNVYITKSLPAINKIFFNDNKLKTFNESLDLLSSEEFDQSFIASPLKNDGLLRFEFSVQSNGNASQGRGVMVSIRLLETSKLLEYFLLENDPYARIINKRTDTLQNTIKHQIEKGGYRGAPVKLASGNFNERIRRSNRYYMAFGSSNNLKDWSGPYSMELATASLRNDDNNSRVIEVTFVPQLASFKSWSPKLGTLLGYNDNLQNINSFVTDKSILEAKSSQTWNNAFNKEYNLDKRVRDVLKGYIGSFTNTTGNAVVVFPQIFGSVKIRDRKQFGPGEDFLNSDYEFTGGVFTKVEDINESGMKLLKTAELIKYLYGDKSSRVAQAYMEQIGFAVSNQIASKQEAENKKKKEEIEKNFDDFKNGKGPENLENKFNSLQEKKKNDAVDKSASDYNRRRESFEQRAAARAGTPIVLEPGVGYNLDVIEAFIIEQQNTVNATGLPPTPIGFPENGSIEERYSWAIDRELTIALDNILKISDREIAKAENDFEKSLESNSVERKEFARSEKEKALKNLEKESNGGDSEGPIDDANNNANKSEDEKAKSAQQLNFEAKWDILTDSIVTRFNQKNENVIVKLIMEQRNMAPQEIYDGFSPLVSPLIKFASNVKAKGGINTNGYYDFYEETDIRVLKLWKKHGIIADAESPAYVFGDMDQIKKLLYLDTDDGPLDTHSINTVFGLAFFDDLDGTLDSDYGLITSESAKRYKAYIKDFDSEFPKSGRTLQFIHNMQGANVTKLDYRLDNYIAALAEMPAKPLVDQGAIATTRLRAARDAMSEIVSPAVTEQLAKFDAQTSLNALVNDFMVAAGGGQERVSDLALAIAEEPALYTQRSSMDLFSMLFFLQNFDRVKELIDNNSTYSIQRNLTYEESFDKYYKAMLDFTMKNLYKCTIRTLPFFGVKSYWEQKCTLAGKVGGLTGYPQRGQTNIKKQDAPYNGDYNIFGFRHIIDTKNIYSEFELYRDGFGSGLFFRATQTSVKELLCGLLNDLVKQKNNQLNTYVNDVQEFLNREPSLLNQSPPTIVAALRDIEGRSVIEASNAVTKRAIRALTNMGCGIDTTEAQQNLQKMQNYLDNFEPNGK